MGVRSHGSLLQNTAAAHPSAGIVRREFRFFCAVLPRVEKFRFLLLPLPRPSLVRIRPWGSMLDRMALPTSTARRKPARLWIDAQAWAIRRLHALHRNRPPAHLRVGALGEREALFYLRRSGYTITARRWKSSKFRGDLDLVGWHDNVLCFIEVKTRSHRDAFAAEFTVDSEKQRVLRRLARAYLRRLPESVRPATARFDVLSIYLTSQQETKQSGEPQFVLNKGAFEWA